MSIQKISNWIENAFDNHSVGSYFSVYGTDILVAREIQTREWQATLYNPLICLIIQGTKEIDREGETTRVNQGEYLIVSHDVPVMSKIVGASPQIPYQAVIMPIDFSILRTVYAELDQIVRSEIPAKIISTEYASSSLVDAFFRYLLISNQPTELKILGPLLQKEIHFRLLLSASGVMLRTLLKRDSHASLIARAICIIRDRFSISLNMPAIATEIGMSTSGFYKHFKEITGTSPLQYQKDLRLLEAQRLLLDGVCSIAEVGYAIGYESATQFSREFSRKFGQSPKQFQVARG